MPVFSMVKAEEQKDAPKKSVWDVLYQWRILLSSVLFILVIVSGTWFLVYPRWTLLSDIQNLTVEQKKTNSDLREFVARLNTLSRNYEEAMANPGLKTLPTIFPDSIDLARILVDFESIAQKTGLKLNGVDVDKEGSAPAPSKGRSSPNALPKGVQSYSIKVQFQAPGSYSDYKKLLTVIESSLPLYDVLVGNIQAQEENVDTGDQSLTFTIQSYFFPKAEAKKG